MYQSTCKKCGSDFLHTEVKGSNTGLYCNNCGTWQKWLSKDEIRAFAYNNTVSQMRKSTPEENKAKAITELRRFVKQNAFDDKTVIDRLNEFIDRIDKEIDSEMDKMPMSQEDAIRKNAYCFALEKTKYSIENIINGKDYDCYNGVDVKME